MKRILLLLCLPILTISAESVRLKQAIDETRKDVQITTDDLNQVREEVRSQRLPLANELSELQKRTASLREDVRQIRNAQNLRERQSQNLEKEVNQLQQENDFVESMMQEYRRSLETRAHTAEIPYIREQFTDDPLLLWAEVSEWVDLRTGGYSFAGTVLDAEGREQVGDFYLMGPVGYFVNDELGGLVISRPNSFLPGVYSFEDSKKVSALKSLLQGESALIPVDVSGGDAIKLAEAKPSVLEQLKQGGVIIVPLLLLGGSALLMALYKTVDLNRMKVQLEPETLALLHALTDENTSEVLAKIGEGPEPLASVTTAAIQHRHASREHLEEILHEHVLAVVPRLERSLGTLAVFGGVAPLLGLLGTVTGMIHTFQLVTIFGSGNAQTLSGGISEALVTTMVGLIIAIPILLVHAFLARKAKTLLGELEQTGVALVNHLKSVDSTKE